MAATSRPTRRLTKTCRPLVGALLVALVACGTPAGTTRGLVEERPPGRATAAAPIALAPSAPVVLGPMRAAAAPSFATDGDDILERTPSAPTTLVRECVTPSTPAGR